MRVTLRSDGLQYTIGDGSSLGCNLTDKGIEGWYGTPDPKWAITERQSGDGAHSVSKPEILYSARTVSLNVRFEAEDPAGAIALRDELAAFAHRHVEMEVEDPNGTTTVTGLLSFVCDMQRLARRIPAMVTLVCTDPRRYGTSHEAYLMPGVSGEGGLLYDSETSYILLPIQFAGEVEVQNSATIQNNGSSEAYPVITCQGSFPDGVKLNWAGGQLVYPAPIGGAGPLVLDCRTHTASIRGVDVTRSLTSRDFPSIPAGGSLTLSLFASGNGTVTVSVRDTYL